jgi:uncharacterized membrane protein
MRSKFSVFGHPLHPLMVAVPVGLFIWTLVADVVYLATARTAVWYEIAFWTGMAAIVTALLAALPGFGDYFTVAVHSDARTIATAHMLLNLAVVALFFVAMLLMLNSGATAGVRLTAVFLLHLVGVGLLAVSGWLGGEMVFRHHLAMIPDDPDAERAELRRHDVVHQPTQP